MSENPKVTSKFDRMHGHPRKPGHVTHPGGTAPISGSSAPGHTENGHKHPQEISHGYGAPVQTHHEPHAGRMAEGQGSAHSPKDTQYDRRGKDGQHG